MPALDQAVVFEWVAALFGLIVGSFANVCIHRIPLEQSIAFPASRCPRCLSPIAPWQNLPLVSWLLLSGRCASCRAPISPRYPLVEAAHGLGFGALVHLYSPSPFTAVLFAYFFALVVLALIDWDHQILPDVITLPGILLGMASSLVPGAWVSWRESALTAAGGFLGFLLVARAYESLRGVEGLGMGDWKLAAMLGSFMGAQRLLLIVFLGSLSGMVYGLIGAYRQRADNPEPEEPAMPLEPPPAVEQMTAVPPEEVALNAEPAPSLALGADLAGPPHPSIGAFRLPFGTFLAGSAIFVLFLGDQVLAWYASLFRF